MNRKYTLLAVAFILTAALAPVATAQAQQESRGADLYIEQPANTETSVGVSTSNTSVPVYEVRGYDRESLVRITPQNFEPGNVVNFGLESGSGTLRYNGRSNEYVLDTQNNNGSFRAYWIVEEQRLVNTTVTQNNTTTTEQQVRAFRVKYTAVIQFEPQNYQLVKQGALAEMEQDAANWTDLEETITDPRVAGQDANVQAELQSAINYLRLLHHPWAALTGEFTAILLSLFITLGGLLVLALFGAYHIWATRFEKSYVNRIESLEAEREDIDERHDKLLQEERQKVLANLDWQDLGFPDHVAAAFRDSFGETVLEGWMTLQGMLLPENIIRDRLEAMGKVDYHAAVVYDDDNLATDGGEDGDETTRQITDARILPLHLTESTKKPDVGEDEEVVHIDDLEGDQLDQLVEAVDWSDDEMLAFDLTNAEFDRDELSSVLDSQNAEELIEKVEQQVGDGRAFDTREEYLEYIVQFAADVRMHEFTDNQGAAKPIRYMLETWLRVAQITSDRYNFPFADYTVENLQLILMNEDIGADVSRYVKEVEAGKYG